MNDRTAHRAAVEAGYASVAEYVEKFADPKWTEPRWPGDGVRTTMFRRGDEIGDVRIQHYGVGTYLVAAYLPGYETNNPGDTPKMNPDRHEWVETTAEANEFFDIYVANAKLDGWIIISPTGRTLVDVDLPL